MCEQNYLISNTPSCTHELATSYYRSTTIAGSHLSSVIDGSVKTLISILAFKSEWATVKDEQLYVGSMGKEWTSTTGEFVNNNPLWVKTVSVLGETHSLNWVSNFKRLRQAINIEFPGKIN